MLMVRIHFNVMIHLFVLIYLSGPTPEPECNAAVANLVEMGFSEVKFCFFYYTILTNYL